MMKRNVLILFTLLLFFTTLVNLNLLNTSSEQTPLDHSFLGRRASGDPDLPDPLANDTSVPEWYGSVSDYYYITANASPALYHVIWVQSTDTPEDDFSVFLYSDPDYNDLETYSIVGDYDWVVTRPATTRPLYPTIHTYSTAGNAYIEWEDSSCRLNASSDTVTGTLNLSERIEVYGLQLTTSSKYTITLNASAGLDLFFDLYYMLPGDAKEGSYYVVERDTAGVGGDEVLNAWTPTVSGEWVLVVARGSGTGNYTLTITGQSEGNGGGPIPLDIFPAVLAIFVIILLKRKDLFNKAPNL